jgi:hypothetical protein
MRLQHRVGCHPVFSAARGVATLFVRLFAVLSLGLSATPPWPGSAKSTDDALEGYCRSLPLPNANFTIDYAEKEQYVQSVIRPRRQG